MSIHSEVKKITAPLIRAKKGKEKIACLTAYDYPMARWCDEAGMDVVLVGDSLSNVIYGETTTLPMTMEIMLAHTRAVAKGTKRALVVADMPFLSYQISKEEAVRNAGRFLKEAGAEAVKLEGGLEMEETIAAIVRAGIPVMAHIGLTPQSVHAMGGFKTQGKTPSEREVLMESARAVERAGAFSVVLECVEASLAAEITKTLHIPTIGIGSGPVTGNDAIDGQILVIHDLLGLTEGKTPKFVIPTGNFRAPLVQAISEYVSRTKNIPVTKVAPPQFKLPNTESGNA